MINCQSQKSSTPKLSLFSSGANDDYTANYKCKQAAQIVLPLPLSPCIQCFQHNAAVAQYILYRQYPPLSRLTLGVSNKSFILKITSVSDNCGSCDCHTGLIIFTEHHVTRVWVLDFSAHCPWRDLNVKWCTGHHWGVSEAISFLVKRSISRL